MNFRLISNTTVVDYTRIQDEIIKMLNKQLKTYDLPEYLINARVYENNEQTGK